jgi:peroxiredoxin
MSERKGRRIWRLGLVIAIAGLIVLGWTQRHRFVPVGEGTPAPEYSAETLDGREVSLASLRGRVVVLNVWATWCYPCVKEMPTLQHAYELLKDEGLEVVAVSVDAPVGSVDPVGNPGGDVAAFVKEFGLTFTVLRDPQRKIDSTFALIGIPSTFVINKQGTIVRKVVGIENWDDEAHLSELRKLLAEKP